MPIDVSLILNLHREGGYVLRTLMSLKEANAFARVHNISVELVVVLDRADEQTRSALRQSDLSSFQRKQIIETDFGSPCMARNLGCEMTLGKYISFCDGDDLISFNAIAAMYYSAEQRGPKTVLFPEWHVSFGKCYHFTQFVDLKYVTPLSFIDIHPYTYKAFFCRTACDLTKFPDVRNPVGYAYEDWHFNSELVANGFDLRVVEDTILFYRQKSDGVFSQHNMLSVRTIPPSKLFEPEIFLKIGREDVKYLQAGATPPAPLKGKAYFDTDVARMLLAAANRIEPEIELGAIKNSEEYVVSRASRPAIGLAYYEACKLVGAAKFSHVFLLPWVTRGGADRVLLNVANSLNALRPNERILVLLGQNELDNAWLSKFSEAITVIDLAPFLPSIGEEGVDLVTLKLIQSCCPGATLHLRTSIYAFRFFRSFGRALDEHKTIVYLFGNDVVQDGEFFFTLPFTFSFISEHERLIDRFITDSEVSASFCRERTCTAMKWKVLPTLCDPTTTRAAAVKRARRGGKHVLWASRLTEQKRPKLLTEIALALSSAKSDLLIEVWGAAEDSFDPVCFAGLSNVIYKGAYNSFAAIAETGFLCLIYTSYFDGVPTVLMEAAGEGLPIVAPDVGGVGEFVLNGETGILLPSLAGEEDMAAAYVRAVIRLAEDADLRVTLAGNAYDRLIAHHAKDAYTASLKEAFGIADDK
jgi:glycosyltransferase involved in cell wall biosynthesis